jgi:hypothetical protein
MLLCWVMGIAQRSFMMSPQLAPTRNAGAFCLRGLGTNWCWDEFGFRAVDFPGSPTAGPLSRSPE